MAIKKFPTTDEEVAAAEAAGIDQVELPESLRDPDAVFRRGVLRHEMVRIKRTPQMSDEEFRRVVEYTRNEKRMAGVVHGWPGFAGGAFMVAAHA